MKDFFRRKSMFAEWLTEVELRDETLFVKAQMEAKDRFQSFLALLTLWLIELQYYPGKTAIRFWLLLSFSPR